jgi:hypothetical protein
MSKECYKTCRNIITDVDIRYLDIFQNFDGTHLAPFVIKAYRNTQEKNVLTKMKPGRKQVPNSSAVMKSKYAIFLPWFQGLYYFISGVWPLLSITSFQIVTGPKVDIWLVKTVGSLLMVTGLVLIMVAIRRRTSLEIIILAIGNAFALTVIEVIYWSNGTISAIYLLDSVVEVLLIIGWLLLWRRMIRASNIQS